MIANKKQLVRSLDQYAHKSVLIFSGSLLVLSVAFNNVGIGKILDAYAQQMIQDISKQSNLEIRVTQLELRLVDSEHKIAELKKIAHKSNK